MLMSQSASSSPTPRSTSRVMTTGLIGPDSLHRGNLALVELTKLKVGGRVGPWSRMSALGQKQTCAVREPILLWARSGLMQMQQKRSLIDHLVGGHEEAGRHRKTKCLRCLEVDSRPEVFIAAR